MRLEGEEVESVCRQLLKEAWLRAGGGEKGALAPGIWGCRECGFEMGGAWECLVHRKGH